MTESSDPSGVPRTTWRARIARLRPWQPTRVATSLATASQTKTSAPHVPPRSRLGTIIHYARRGAWYALLIAAGWYATMLTLILLFRFVDPPGSALMAIRWLSGEQIEQTWVPLDRVAPIMRRAVVTSEDTKFCQHWGFDLGEIRAAMSDGEGFGRGASTLSMQVAKNMFLWPDRSYVRKALEVPLTLTIEAVWPKRRIFEIYMNIAEWGPGLFGIEAASRVYFGKPAARLGEREAALLAVALPNPIARDASDPEPKQARLATRLQARMKNEASFPCVLP